MTLLTCGNDLLTCGNNLLTCGNDFLSCGNDLLTCGNDLVSCGNDLLTCGNDFLSCGNDLLSCGNEIKKCKENSSMSLSGLRKYTVVLLLGANYRSARSRDGTCAISASKDRAPISRLLKQSRDGAAPTQNDFYHTILRYDWLYSFLGWSMIG